MVKSANTTTVPTTPQETGPFKQRPGRYVVEEFLKWITETGRPDTWRYHDPSKPPSSADFEELARFHIPMAKRAEAGMATCPICSPASPKYFAGALAWFPTEGVLRSIGHECAKTHFGVERANAAIARRKHREAIESAQDFLIETLPEVVALRSEVEALRPTALNIDRVRQVILSAASKTACEKLAKLGAPGVFPVQVSRRVDSVDIYGKDTTRWEVETVATYPVSGLAFLTRRFVVVGLAQACAQALGAMQAASSQDEALEFVCNELKADTYLFDAERLARNAVLSYSPKLGR